MKKTFFSIIAIGAIIFMSGAGCGLSNNPPDNSVQGLPIDEPQNSSPQSQTHIVQMMNFAFNPQILEINVGDTIRWENFDAVLHDVVSDTFSSDKFSKGGTFSYTFNQAGEFSYYCSLHPRMTGRIMVK